MPDHLSTGMVVPVHPPIARRLGYAARDDFSQPAVFVEAGGSRAVRLPAYVALSFQIYRGEPREALAVDTVMPTIACLADLLVTA